MEAIRLNTTIQKDGELFLKELPCKRGQEVEIILLIQPHDKESKTNLTVKELLQSELVGMWENREDIKDSSSFARQLREKAQSRGE